MPGIGNPSFQAECVETAIAKFDDRLVRKHAILPTRYASRSRDSRLAEGERSRAELVEIARSMPKAPVPQKPGTGFVESGFAISLIHLVVEIHLRGEHIGTGGRFQLKN